MNGNQGIPDAFDLWQASLYSLEKLIEWKLTLLSSTIKIVRFLYSLEKLIEWKLYSISPIPHFQFLYSLEKLIEWKLVPETLPLYGNYLALLAREIN